MRFSQSDATALLRRILDAPRGAEGEEQAWLESLLWWFLDRDRLATISTPNRGWRLTPGRFLLPPNAQPAAVPTAA